MNKYRVHYKVLAQHFGEEMTRGQIEVFANSLDEAKQEVEEFITENARRVDPNAQYFGNGGRQLKVNKCKHNESETIPIAGTYETITICCDCGEEL